MPLEDSMGHKTVERDHDDNRDPISGAPGSHPVGTGLGAAAGGLVSGAAAGASAGPVGTIAGAALGAVVGGLTGKAVAEIIDPTAEEAYWRDNYLSRPYVDSGLRFDDYAPAYRCGVDAYERYQGRPFEEAEPELERDWERTRGSSRLAWDDAKHAVRDAWQRISDSVERAI